MTLAAPWEGVLPLEGHRGLSAHRGAESCGERHGRRVAHGLHGPQPDFLGERVPALPGLQAAPRRAAGPGRTAVPASLSRRQLNALRLGNPTSLCGGQSPAGVPAARASRHKPRERRRLCHSESGLEADTVGAREALRGRDRGGSRVAARASVQAPGPGDSACGSPGQLGPNPPTWPAGGRRARSPAPSPPAVCECRCEDVGGRRRNHP